MRINRVIIQLVKGLFYSTVRIKHGKKQDAFEDESYVDIITTHRFIMVHAQLYAHFMALVMWRCHTTKHYFSLQAGRRVKYLNQRKHVV